MFVSLINLRKTNLPIVVKLFTNNKTIIRKFFISSARFISSTLVRAHQFTFTCTVIFHRGDNLGFCGSSRQIINGSSG